MPLSLLAQKANDPTVKSSNGSGFRLGIKMAPMTPLPILVGTLHVANDDEIETLCTCGMQMLWALVA